MNHDAAGTPDWVRVNELFHRALELDPVARAAFVRRESADDEAVASEVLSLLESYARSSGFLSTPPASPHDHVAAGRVGQKIGQYRIDAILGEGGMGVVYLAQDERLGLPVALKAISPAVAAQPEARERLRREARAAAALRGHAGIATVYSLEEFGGDFFIVSEFVEGETLRAEIDRGPVPVSRVIADGIELARTLAAAHNAGIVHRDFKPENVIRSKSGVLKILDFGLARMRDTPPELARLTHDGRHFGTPGYMSPEQIRRDAIDGRSDLFALGIVLHELLTGTHPFNASDSAATIARILEADPAIVSAARPADPADAALHDGLIEIVRALVRKNPAARFESGDELASALERLRDGHAGVVTADSAPWSASRRWWRIHQAITSAAYALLLVPIALAADTLSDGRVRMAFFLAALAFAVGAIAIRLHLWFEAASRPTGWNAQYSRSWRWLRVCDVGYAATMIALALTIDSSHNVWETILVAGGVLVLVSALLIEPATTRAAFDQR